MRSGRLILSDSYEIAERPQTARWRHSPRLLRSETETTLGGSRRPRLCARRCVQEDCECYGSTTDDERRLSSRSLARLSTSAPRRPAKHVLAARPARACTLSARYDHTPKSRSVTARISIPATVCRPADTSTGSWRIPISRRKRLWNRRDGLRRTMNLYCRR